MRFKPISGPWLGGGLSGAFRGFVAGGRAEGPLGGLLGTRREDAGSGLGTFSFD